MCEQEEKSNIGNKEDTNQVKPQKKKFYWPDPLGDIMYKTKDQTKR